MHQLGDAHACSLLFEPFHVLLVQLLPLVRVRHLTDTRETISSIFSNFQSSAVRSTQDALIPGSCCI